MKKIFLLLFSLSSFVAVAQPDTVKAGAYVISVHDINFHDKEYTIRFWLWFLYSNPEFDFTKQLDIPNAKDIDEPVILTDSVAGKKWVQLKMKCTMKEAWDVEDFPFDQQHLRVRVENTVFDRRSLVFKADTRHSIFDHTEGLDGWRLTKFTVSTDTSRYNTGFGDPRVGHDSQTFSAFHIDMDIEREAWGLFLKIFIGMYIAFLIALVSFVSHPWEHEPRFGLPVGGLFAAVGNKYIIDSLLPESPEFSLVDILHSTTFFGILSVLAVSALALKFYNDGDKERCLRVDRIGSRIVTTAYIVVNLYFVISA